MTVAMVLVVLGIQLVLGVTAQRDIRQVLDDRSQRLRQVIAAGLDRPAHRAGGRAEPGMVRLRRRRQPDRGLGASDVRAAADRLATTDGRPHRAGARATRTGCSATPFTTPSGDTGVLVVSQETGPYERSELYALLAADRPRRAGHRGDRLMALRVTSAGAAPGHADGRAGRRTGASTTSPTASPSARRPTSWPRSARRSTTSSTGSRRRSAPSSGSPPSSPTSCAPPSPRSRARPTSRCCAVSRTRASVRTCEQISASAREMAGGDHDPARHRPRRYDVGREQCRLADVVPGLVAAVRP